MNHITSEILKDARQLEKEKEKSLEIQIYHLQQCSCNLVMDWNQVIGIYYVEKEGEKRKEEQYLDERSFAYRNNMPPRKGILGLIIKNISSPITIPIDPREFQTIRQHFIQYRKILDS